MNVKGIILDADNKPVRDGQRVLCEIALDNGHVECQFIESNLLVKFAQSPTNYADTSQTHTGENMEVRNAEADFHWEPRMVKLLIESYRVTVEDPKNKKCMQKEIWAKVARMVNTKLKCNVSSAQCDSKWKGLTKTYKKHRKLVEDTGESPRFWEYYNLMDDFLYDKPQINPVALSSNLKGYRERLLGSQPIGSKAKSPKPEQLKENDANLRNNLNEKVVERKQQHLIVRKRRFADKISTSDEDSQSGGEETEDHKSTPYRKRSSLSKRALLLLEKKHKSDRDLKERFINVFEEYVNIYKNSQAKG